MQILQKTNFNFLRWRWHALVLSLVIICAGVATIMTRGLPLGIDFTGGTVAVARFQRPLGDCELLNAFGSVPVEKTVKRYGPAENNEWFIRLPQMAGREEGRILEQGKVAIENALTASSLGTFENKRTTI